jgi:hypothetical protein
MCDSAARAPAFFVERRLDIGDLRALRRVVLAADVCEIDGGSWKLQL